MEQTETEKKLSMVKNYVIPAMVFICGVAVSWSVLNSEVKETAEAVERLEERTKVIENSIVDTSTRLVRIETQLEEIYKIVDDK